MSGTAKYRNRDIIVPLDDEWTSQTIIRVIDDGRILRYISEGGTNPGWVKEHLDLSHLFIAPRAGTKEHIIVEEIENHVGKYLDAATNGQMELEGVRNRLEGQRFDHELIEGTLRLLLGRGRLVAFMTNHKPPRVALRLSNEGRAFENKRAFATAFANDLSAKSEQLGRLLDHKPTVGGAREEMLRVLLEKHIPKRYHVATGFVEGSPSQIDILIYDQIDYAPLFREGNLVVVPFQAVRAMIEVKSQLTRGELADALAHLDKATVAIQDGPPVFRGVFGYDGATALTLIDAFVQHHQEPADEIPETSHIILDAYGMIDAICVLGSVLLTTGFAQLDDERNSRSPMIVEMKSKADRPFHAAVFFDLLMRHLRYPLAGALNQPGLTSHFAIDLRQEHATLIYKSSEWMPYMFDDHIEELEAKIAQKERWIDGQAWIV